MRLAAVLAVLCCVPLVRSRVRCHLDPRAALVCVACGGFGFGLPFRLGAALPCGLLVGLFCLVVCPARCWRLVAALGAALVCVGCGWIRLGAALLCGLLVSLLSLVDGPALRWRSVAAPGVALLRVRSALVRVRFPDSDRPRSRVRFGSCSVSPCACCLASCVVPCALCFASCVSQLGFCTGVHGCPWPALFAACLLVATSRPACRVPCPVSPLASFAVAPAAWLWTPGPFSGFRSVVLCSFFGLVVRVATPAATHEKNDDEKD